MFSTGKTLLVVGACAAVAFSNFSSAQANGSLRDVRIFVEDDCPITGKEKLLNQPHAFALLPLLGATLFNILIPKIVDIGIGYAAKEAKAAGAGDNSILKVSGVGAMSGFYQLRKGKTDKQLTFGPVLADKCLVVARGGFGSKLDGVSDIWAKEKPKKFLNDNGFSRKPDIYLESRVRISRDRASFRIEPVYLAIAGLLHSNPGPYLDFQIDFKFEKASGDPNPSFAIGSLAFEHMTRETLIQRSLDNKSSPWMPVLPVDDKIQGVITKVQGYYDEQKKLTGDIGKLPKELAGTLAKLKLAPIPDLEKNLEKAILALEKRKQDVAASLRENKFTDRIFFAELDVKPETTSLDLPEDTKDWKAKATRTLNRLAAVKGRDAERSALEEEHNIAQSGLTKIQELTTKKQQLIMLTAQIEEIEKENPVFAGVNIVVTISEQNHKPENKFLLTLGELLDNSKTDLANAAKSYLTPEGRELARQGDYTRQTAVHDADIALIEKLKAVALAEITLKGLASDASILERKQAEYELALAKAIAEKAAAAKTEAERLARR